MEKIGTKMDGPTRWLRQAGSLVRLAATILLSAELYVLYMFLDWRVSNWSDLEARGASTAATSVLIAALIIQPVCAWFVIQTTVGLFGSASPSYRPLVWRYTLALIATICVTFGCALCLYFLTGIRPLGLAQNELATAFQRLFR